jgi:hypothetical protein
MFEMRCQYCYQTQQYASSPRTFHMSLMSEVRGGEGVRFSNFPVSLENLKIKKRQLTIGGIIWSLSHRLNHPNSVLSLLRTVSNTDSLRQGEGIHGLPPTRGILSSYPF